jgi:hypothetical protein
MIDVFGILGSFAAPVHGCRRFAGVLIEPQRDFGGPWI